MKKKRAEEVLKSYRDEFSVVGLKDDEPIPDFIMKFLPSGIRPEIPDHFHIRALQEKEINPENIFGDEDFISYADKSDHRSKMFVKIGSLFVQFTPHGKGGYELDIEFINKANRTKNLAFHFDGVRYPDFQFDEIVPFSFGDETSTFVDRKPSPIIPLANRLRTSFTQMALGIDNDEVRDKFRRSMIDFFSATNNQPRMASHSTNFFKEQLNRDVIDFGKDFSIEPKNEKELAAKIAASFLSNLVVDRDHYKAIINDYIAANQIPIEKIDKNFIDRIMLQLVDNQKYCLKTILPEENPGSILSEIIDEIKKESLILKSKP